MKFLIKINHDSELICYEAIALAFTLATFDHQVQLSFGKKSLPVLLDATSRLYGMIQSLSLYDLPPAWHELGQDFASLDDCLQACFANPGQSQSDDFFDSLLEF